MRPGDATDREAIAGVLHVLKEQGIEADADGLAA